MWLIFFYYKRLSWVSETLYNIDYIIKYIKRRFLLFRSYT